MQFSRYFFQRPVQPLPLYNSRTISSLPKEYPFPISSHSPKCFTVFSWPTNKKSRRGCSGSIRDLRWTLQMCEDSTLWWASLPLIFWFWPSFFNCMCKSQLLSEAEKSNLDSEQLKVWDTQWCTKFYISFTSLSFKKIFLGFWFILLVNNNKTLITYLQSHG